MATDTIAMEHTLEEILHTMQRLIMVGNNINHHLFKIDAQFIELKGSLDAIVMNTANNRDI